MNLIRQIYSLLEGKRFLRNNLISDFLSVTYFKTQANLKK